MKLKIHVWGGFGSQLYALALLLKLQNSSAAHRRFELVFHNGGVTLREPEILDLIPSGVDISVVRDFRPILNYKRQMANDTLRNSLKECGKRFLSESALVVDLSKGYKQLRWWTLSVRGHYKYLPISFSILQQVLISLNDASGSSASSPTKGTLVVHYRLGDLIGLKTIIPEADLVSAIHASISDACTSIVLYTDSTNMVRQFPHSINNRPVVVLDAPIRDMFENALSATIFVGTDSKISFWLTYLRLTKDRNSINVMPKAFKSELELTIGDSSNFQNLEFY
jgi:hypothetical protein